MVVLRSQEGLETMKKGVAVASGAFGSSEKMKKAAARAVKRQGTPRIRVVTRVVER
jgi:hypothetical protein